MQILTNMKRDKTTDTDELQTLQKGSWSSFPLGRGSDKHLSEDFIASSMQMEMRDFPPIRNRVFNQELKDVASSILTHDPENPQGDTAGENIPNLSDEDVDLPPELTKPLTREELGLDQYFKHEFEVQYDRKTFDYLLDLSRKKDLDKVDFEPILKHMALLARTDTVAFLMYDNSAYACRVFLDFGLDPYTRKNLYMGFHEPYFVDEEKIQQVSFQGNLGKDINFRKRFSSNFYRRFEGFDIVKMKEYGINGLLLLFYRRFEQDGKDEYRKELKQLLLDSSPVIRRFGDLQESKSIRVTESYSMETVIQMLRTMSNNRSDSLKIYYLLSRDLAEHVDWKNRIQTVARLIQHGLNPEERTVVLAPGRIMIITYHTDRYKLENRLYALSNQMGFEYKMIEVNYPEDGINFVNYVDPVIIH